MDPGSCASNRLLVAVGSRRERVCSIGAFARAEALALERVFSEVQVLEPDGADAYPKCDGITEPDAILFHAPALHDRKRPWNALLTAVRLKRAFPRAQFIPVVHEYSESPWHWRIRQAAIVKLARGVIVNSDADERGVRRWHRHVLRSRLGPTIAISPLVSDRRPDPDRSRALGKMRRELRNRLALEHALPTEAKWVLHPGLITPGKGVDSLSPLAQVIGREDVVVLMGVLGPKATDREFAAQALAELRGAFGGRFRFVEAPADEQYSWFLLASDLVVLPYDIGLSERRSSFLSAMSCGANVWTTTGKFTAPLEISRARVHVVESAAWRAGDPSTQRSVRDALGELDAATVERRLRNLDWARERGWARRAGEIAEFISALKRSPDRTD